MPPLPDVPSTLRVAISGSDAGNVDVATRFYIFYSGTAPTVTQLDAFCTSVASTWNTNLAGQSPTTFTLTGVEAIDLTSPTAAVGSAAVSHAGTRTGTALPLQDAAVISYTIARRYRGGHPRGYWRFGITTDLANSRTFNAANALSFQTNTAAFFAGVLADGWTGAGTLGQVNVSYYEGFHLVTPPSGRTRAVPTLRVGGPISDAVTGYVGRTSIGTQRRRIQFQL